MQEMSEFRIGRHVRAEFSALQQPVRTDCHYFDQGLAELAYMVRCRHCLAG